MPDLIIKPEATTYSRTQTFYESTNYSEIIAMEVVA